MEHRNHDVEDTTSADENVHSDEDANVEPVFEDSDVSDSIENALNIKNYEPHSLPEKRISITGRTKNGKDEKKQKKN